MKKIVAIIGILGLILIGIQVFHPIANVTNTQAPQAVQQKNPTITYRGENGKNALVLLKQYTTIEQDHSGLVISINGRKADNAKHEYWAFYVNGKYASVGPASYQTKKSDVITWKIEKY